MKLKKVDACKKDVRHSLVYCDLDPFGDLRIHFWCKYLGFAIYLLDIEHSTPYNTVAYNKGLKILKGLVPKFSIS